MQIRIIDERLGLSGNNIQFEKEPFFELNPDDEVLQIGDGRENGCIRTDKFNSPIKYMGSIILKFDKEEKMFAFKISGHEYDFDVFFLYGSTGLEVFTEAKYTKKLSYMRFYAPVFIKSN